MIYHNNDINLDTSILIALIEKAIMLNILFALNNPTMGAKFVFNIFETFLYYYPQFPINILCEIIYHSDINFLPKFYKKLR